MSNKETFDWTKYDESFNKSLEKQAAAEEQIRKSRENGKTLKEMADDVNKVIRDNGLNSVVIDKKEGK